MAATMGVVVSLARSCYLRGQLSDIVRWSGRCERCFGHTGRSNDTFQRRRACLKYM